MAYIFKPLFLINDQGVHMSNEENKVSDNVTDLAKKLMDKIKVDEKTGVGTAEEGIYKDTLPEGITMKTVEAIKRHDRDFIAAGAEVFGTLAIEAMAKNKKLEEASLSIGMSKVDSVTYHVDRHRQYQNHLSGDGKPVDKFGILTTTYEAKGGKNAGDLKKVRLGLQEIAAKKLAAK